MQKHLRCLVLSGIWLALSGCATPPAVQPEDTQPYALLVLPESIRLLAVDTQVLDARLHPRRVRLPPGPHSLHLVYVGPSPSHAGQQADPLWLETQAGYQYVFEAKT